MATEAGAALTRRSLLLGTVLGGMLPRTKVQAASPSHHGHWVSAWNDQGGHRVGLLQRAADGWRVAASIDVPTRAHGLTVLPDGSVIAVARRPGDWLLRWWPSLDGRPARAPRWRWAPAGRQFNGHAVLHPDGRHLLLTATDTEADDGLGRGLLMRMRLDGLEPVAEAPTLGRDPHQLQIVPEAKANGLRLWVANGGIASRPETGRARLIDAPMDASVAARIVAPRPNITAGRTEFVYTRPMTGLPQGDSPMLLNASYTITADITVPQGGAAWFWLRLLIDLWLIVAFWAIAALWMRREAWVPALRTRLRLDRLRLD